MNAVHPFWLGLSPKLVVVHCPMRKLQVRGFLPTTIVSSDSLCPSVSATHAGNHQF